MRIKPAALLLPVLLAGCATQRSAVPVQPTITWRSAATSDDRERLRDWHATFRGAVLAANRSGRDEEVAREGALLQPDSAIVGGPIPNGDYRCRVIKLGAKSQGLLDFVAYPYFQCRVEQAGRLQRFAKLTGSQRYVGRIYPGDALRQVFLGTLVLGDESQAMAYGIDRERDVAGYVERIGPARWRMIMPSPHFESQLDVLELVPAS
jgi:hypothetical protein